MVHVDWRLTALAIVNVVKDNSVYQQGPVGIFLRYDHQS